MRVVALACLLIAGIVTAEEVKSYHGHQVLSVKAHNEKQVAILRDLQDTQQEILFLNEPTQGPSTELVVPPELRIQVLHMLSNAGISITVQSTDLQEDIDAVMRENEANRQRHARQGPTLVNGHLQPQHDVYYNYSDVNDIMLYFETEYPDLAVRRTLPHASERDGKTIYYMELGTQGSDDKPVIFIEGLAHAREWIVTTSLIYSMDRMLSDYGSDFNTTRALDNFTWVIIPMLNPDGYEFSWTNNRMWRKNRKFISSSCSGVDLNRNFDVEFGGVGTSGSCSSDIYHGGAAFSEAETRNVADLFEELEDRVVSFLSVHSYSQLLLYPWGYVSSVNDPSPPDNVDELIRVGELMKEQLDSQGKVFTLGTAYSALGYAATGAAEDWALTVKPGIYSYCYELRPATWGEGGFIISASEIEPSGKELLGSLLVLAGEIPLSEED